MLRTYCGLIVTLSVVAPSQADVVDTFDVSGAASVGIVGDPTNDLFFLDTATQQPYTLGAIRWDGMASPVEDLNAGPNDPLFPTFALELTARITHDQSGQFADFGLGFGGPGPFGQFGPGPEPYAGSSLGLNGLSVNPGDSFTVEFFDDFDDPEIDPDAFWDELTFEFTDEFFPPPAEDVIRFDANGVFTFPTQPGGFGSGFYGIEYGGSGAGPAITNVRLEGHDVTRVWFDQRMGMIGNIFIGDDGQFRVASTDGVSEPTLTLLQEDTDPDFADTYGSLELDFNSDEFEPGDSIRFGILTVTGAFGLGTDGFLLTQLAPEGPLSITITFDDGTKVSAPLLDLQPGEDFGAFADLDVTQRALPSEGDTDGDGDVDSDDLLNTLLGFGIRAGATPLDGDADGQGDVDRDDANILFANLGSQLPGAGSVVASSAVPEPVTAYLALVCTAVALLLARHNRQPRPVTN